MLAKQPSRLGPHHSMETMETAGKIEPFRLIHRLLVFAIALWYVAISAQAFVAAVTVLRGLESKDLGVTVYTSKLIAGYAGETTIHDSPLVQNVLGGSTEPRDDAIYLETDTSVSFTGCSTFEGADSSVYSNGFTRLLFTSLQKHARGNLSYVEELELIAPVVDCTFELLVSADEEVTKLRMYYLARQKRNASEVLLLSALMSTQDFQVSQQYQSGAALLASIAAIEDMRATEVVHHFAMAYNYPYEDEPHFAVSELIGVEEDNFWLFKSQPNEGSIDPVKEVRSAYRFGGYIDDPVAQSNVEIVHWNLQADPASELSNWEWHSLASLHDSWAWTHTIHGIFAMDVFFDLEILFFVIYHRARKGHFWVGDAFATISNALLYRGVLIFAANHLNGYWTLTEFCLAIGNEVAGRRSIHYRPEMVHADLLTFFMNVASILSYLFRERIDPVLACTAFEFGFAYRVEIVSGMSSLRNVVAGFAEKDHWLGLINVSPFLTRLSPMKFWTVHEIKTDRKPVVIATVLSIFSMILWLVLYIIARKAYRYCKRKHDGANHRASRYASKECGSEGEDGLTSFESATGSALSKRYGVISGYDNYVVRNDKRYASIDAVYGNGFLVANGKFLLSTEDIFSLLVMKVTRVRFTNIYVYAILADGAVNQTAQLVYPHTIPWDDFGRIGVAKLS
ncbi:uncharacterized protein KRP23_8238 [Phytophthora ramorum]|nr:hypothetical protein KRP23_8238 [Phytophthora ramorum]